MDPIRSTAPQSTSAPAKPPEKPAEKQPEAAHDQATIGKGSHEDHASLGFRLLRGTAGFVGGAASGVVAAGLGAIRHAGDMHASIPRSIRSLLRINSAAAGMVAGPLFGMAFLGPIGLPLGLVAGPIAGALAGGMVAGGAEAAVDAAKGSVEGARAGFHAGYNYATGLVDDVAGHASHASGAPHAAGKTHPPGGDPILRGPG